MKVMAPSETIFERISATNRIDDLWALTLDHFQQMGFAAVAYLLLRRGQPELPVAIFSQGLPPEFRSAYSEMGYARNDAAARLGLTKGKPFIVSQLGDLTELSRQEARHHRALAESGAPNPLILPVFGPNTVNGIVALGDYQGPGTVESLNWDECQSIAQMIHLRTIALMPQNPAVANPLSERELEILRWVAQGKSNGVIADILGISNSSVDTYLRRIFEKLDVADRTAAAVRGVSAGYIGA
jgi:LuxR family transcriptional regulator/LuxR family quorum-sensing system transcriptional regulator CciR